ncbi:MAG: InlB B-repeat-containing protein [Candidatus Sumerlaeota bacterium]
MAVWIILGWISLAGGAESFTLNYHAGENGMIISNATQVVTAGGDGAPVEAVPMLNYHFVEWSDGSTSNTRTDTNVQADLITTATFAPGDYTLEYTAGEGGWINEEGTTSCLQNVAHSRDGEAVTAIPEANRRFLQWSDGVTDNPRTDTSIRSSIAVTAIFSVPEFTLSYSAGVHGSIGGPTTQSVTHGSDGSTVTATSDAGCYFVEWSDGLTDNPRRDTAVTADLSVEAIFAPYFYSLQYSAGPNGSIDGATSQTVAHGSDGSTVSAVADANYHFTDWSDGATDNPRHDTNVTRSLNVTANFAMDRGSLTVHLLPAGAVAEGAKWRRAGTSQWFSSGATETGIGAGRYFIELSDTPSYAEPDPVAVDIERDQTTVLEQSYGFTLNYASEPQGRLVGEACQFVLPGADGSTVEARALQGYRFARWSDGRTDNPRLDTNVQAGLSVVAIYEGINYAEQFDIIHAGVSENIKIESYQAGLFVSTFSGALKMKIVRKPDTISESIPALFIDGDVDIIVSEARIGALYVSGYARSLLAREAHFGNIHAENIGSVRMFDKARNDWSEGEEEYSTRIYSGGAVAVGKDGEGYPFAETTTPTAQAADTSLYPLGVVLTGVSLQDFCGPGQNADIVLSAKKFGWTDAKGNYRTDLSIARVPFLQGRGIEAGYLRRLMVYGGASYFNDYDGAVMADRIVSHQPAPSPSRTIIMGRSLDTVLMAANGSGVLRHYDGSVVLTTLTARSDRLAAYSLGGDLLVDHIENAGMIDVLGARRGSLRTDMVQTGLDQTFANPHILRVLGDYGVEGRFRAGVTLEGQPSYRGDIGYIRVDSRAAKDARIVGEAHVRGDNVRLIGDPTGDLFFVNP